MDITVNRKEFLAELIPAQRISQSRTTIPVLTHILLRAAGEKLHISATDLELSFTVPCDCELREEGAIAVPAKKLVEVIKASDGEDVELQYQSGRGLHIAVGGCSFTLRGMSAEEFPSIAEVEADPVEIPCRTLERMISKTLFAISTEESRFQLAGALLRLEVAGAATMVATDGHRMAVIDASIEADDGGIGDLLIPRKTLVEIGRFNSDERVELRRTDHHMAFTVGRRQLVSRVLEGTFPDYERVITKQEQKVIANREPLLAALGRISLMTGRSDCVRIGFDNSGGGSITISAENPDLGDATESLDCDYRGPGVELGANASYMMQFLSAADTDLVRFELTDNDKACIGYPVDDVDKRYVYVLMPVRL